MAPCLQRSQCSSTEIEERLSRRRELDRLDEKEKLTKILKQDCLLQDLTELFNCMINNLIYN